MPEPPFEGDWIEEESGLPQSGPQRWWRRISDAHVAVSGPPSRIVSERRGLDAGRAHPACPVVHEATDEWIHFEALGPPPVDPLEVVQSWPAIAQARSGPLHQLLPESAVNPRRALRKLGARRIDRILDRSATASVLVGPSLGGVHSGWLRQANERVVALRWSRFDPQGRPDLDQAATAWHTGTMCNDLALLPHLLEEAVLGKDETARDEALALFADLAQPEPAEVAVEVVGAPEWLDVQRWSGTMSPTDARRVMHHVGGMSVAGQTCRVRVTPSIRKGRAPRRFEPETQRRRRLFSRWYEGIQFDDEGLVSATPEALAEDFVAGIDGWVLDGTCGIGSLAIAAARRPGARVLAVDTNAARLEMAQHNAALYGVRLGLRHGSVLDVLWEPHDVLLLDPPWGGRDYDRQAIGLDDLAFPLAKVLERTDASVRIKLPRSFRVEELPGEGWSIRGAVDRRGILKFLVATR